MMNEQSEAERKHREQLDAFEIALQKMIGVAMLYGRHLPTCRMARMLGAGCNCGWAKIRESLTGEAAPARA